MISCWNKQFYVTTVKVKDAFFPLNWNPVFVLTYPFSRFNCKKLREGGKKSRAISGREQQSMKQLSKVRGSGIHLNLVCNSG